MIVKIKDIVMMEKFKGTRIVSGVTGSHNKVENVNIMEVPDIINYTTQSALLFTTLYPIINDSEALENFIPELFENKLAGVAIKLGRYIKEIPDYMIQQSNELGFPILILPDDANFSELTNKILADLLGMKTTLLEFRETIISQYQQLLLTGGDMDKFVALTSEKIKGDVLILRNDMHVIKSSNKSLKEKYMARKKDFIDPRKYTSDDAQSLTKDLQRLFMTKKVDPYLVISGEIQLGYMVILPGSSAITSQEYQVVIEQAMILLAFLFQSQKNIEQTERSYLDSFIRDMINGKNIKQDEVIEKAKIFDWTLEFPIKLMSIRIGNADKDNKVNRYNQLLDSNQINHIFHEKLGIQKENLKVVLFNGEILLFLNLKDQKEERSKLYKSSLKIIDYFERKMDLQISLSNSIENIDSLAKEYQHLQLVHDIYGNRAAYERYCIFYEDLGIYKFFHAIPQKQIMHDYIVEIIGEILEEDMRKNSELLYTLEILIKNRMNIKKSADELFIHTNSLRYRMDLIKDLGIDLQDGYKLSEISIAIQMNEYLQIIAD